MAIKSVRTRAARMPSSSSSAPADKDWQEESPPQQQQQQQDDEEEEEEKLEHAEAAAEPPKELLVVQGVAEDISQLQKEVGRLQEAFQEDAEGNPGAGDAEVQQLRGLSSSKKSLAVEGMGERLMKQLLKLDSVAGDGAGEEAVRQARKVQVLRVQNLLDDVDTLRESLRSAWTDEDTDGADAGSPEYDLQRQRGQGLAKQGEDTESTSQSSSKDSGGAEEAITYREVQSKPRKLTTAGVLKGGASQQPRKEQTSRRVQFINLPDKVPTMEDKPRREKIHRTRAADILSSFPKSAIPTNAPKPPPPRIRAVQGQAIGQKQAESRVGSAERGAAPAQTLASFSRPSSGGNQQAGSLAGPPHASLGLSARPSSSGGSFGSLGSRRVTTAGPVDDIEEERLKLAAKLASMRPATGNAELSTFGSFKPSVAGKLGI